MHPSVTIGICNPVFPNLILGTVRFPDARMSQFSTMEESPDSRLFSPASLSSARLTRSEMLRPTLTSLSSSDDTLASRNAGHVLVRNLRAMSMEVWFDVLLLEFGSTMGVSTLFSSAASAIDVLATSGRFQATMVRVRWGIDSVLSSSFLR